MSPFLRAPVPGVVSGVGSERLIFNFLMASRQYDGISIPQNFSILAIDYDEEVVKFHKLNAIALKCAKEGKRLQYLGLRFAENLEVIATILKTARSNLRITDNEFDFFETEARWWLENVADREKWKLMTDKNQSDFHFGEFNYLLSDEMFNRIQILAVNEKYKSIQIDLGSDIDLARLIDAFGDRKISIFDLSNAWQDQFPNVYLGPVKTGYLMKALLNLGRLNSRFIVSHGVRNGESMVAMNYAIIEFDLIKKLYSDYSTARFESNSRESFHRIGQGISLEQFIEKDRWNLVANDIAYFVRTISYSPSRVRFFSRYTSSCDLIFTNSERNISSTE